MKKRVEIEKLQVEAEKRHVEQVSALHLRTIEALALAIEAKDHTTHEHLHRVRTYAVEIAQRTGAGQQRLQELFEPPLCSTTSASSRYPTTSSASQAASRRKNSRK